MTQFQLDSRRFDPDNTPREKNQVFPKYKFVDTKVKDPGDQWRNDRDWRVKLNQHYVCQTLVEEGKDKKMLEKRHHAHKLKAISLGQDMKVKDKKIQKELRGLLF